jgi:hypothetical protein
VSLRIGREDAHREGVGATAVRELERRPDEADQRVRIELLEILVAQPLGDGTPEGLHRLAAISLAREPTEEIFDLGMDLGGLDQRGLFDRVGHVRSSAFRR